MLSTGGRRAFLRCCGGGVAGISLGVSIGTRRTRAASHTLKGRLVAYDGDAIAERKVYVSGSGLNGYVPTGETGRFSAEVASNAQYKLCLYKSDDASLMATDLNGVPHIYDLGDVRTTSGGETDVGDITVPRGYLVEMRALDREGNPVADATPGVRHGGFGLGRSYLSTNRDGWAQIRGADFTGLELTGVTELSMEIPTPDGGSKKYSRTVTIDSPSEIVFKVGEGITEDTQTTETATDTAASEEASTPRSASSATETPRRDVTLGSTVESRGFFKNGENADDYEFLKNPLNLTIGGFVLSVAGILYQLLRGN